MFKKLPNLRPKIDEILYFINNLLAKSEGKNKSL